MCMQMYGLWAENGHLEKERPGPRKVTQGQGGQRGESQVLWSAFLTSPALPQEDFQA